MATTYRKLIVIDNTNGYIYDVKISGRWFEFTRDNLKFALYRHQSRCADFRTFDVDFGYLQLTEIPTIGDLFDVSAFVKSRENSMSEKVSKPGDLDKYVPTKTPNFTVQSQDTMVANKVADAATQAVTEPRNLDWKYKDRLYPPDAPYLQKDLKEMVEKTQELIEVKHPKHYNSHPSGVECITIAQHHTFNTGNAIKYLWRAGLKVPVGKNETEAAIKDLQKAKEYIEFEIRRLTWTL